MARLARLNDVPIQFENLTEELTFALPRLVGPKGSDTTSDLCL